jgi:nitroreductase
MDAMEAILSRRSIRKYTPKPVTEDIIHDLLNAAMNAPSAANSQPWHFVTITDRNVLDRITEFHQYATMVKEAPLAVIVCADVKVSLGKDIWVQDCSAATENILIAANAKGLGAVWLGVYPLEDRITGTRRLLGLPENIMPLSIVVAGYPAEIKPPANRFSPDRVHLNKW